MQRTAVHFPGLSGEALYRKLFSFFFFGDFGEHFIPARIGDLTLRRLPASHAGSSLHALPLAVDRKCRNRKCRSRGRRGPHRKALLPHGRRPAPGRHTSPRRSLLPRQGGGKARALSCEHYSIKKLNKVIRLDHGGGASAAGAARRVLGGEAAARLGARGVNLCCGRGGGGQGWPGAASTARRGPRRGAARALLGAEVRESHRSPRPGRHGRGGARMR